MKQISQILIHNHVFFLFIILELISIQIIIDKKFLQKSQFNNIALQLKGYIFTKEMNIHDYFNLKDANNQLLNQNQLLVNEIISIKKNNKLIYQNDTSLNLDTKLIQAHILKNSWNKKRNFMTLNVGKNDSIRKNMGVMTGYSLIGIVNNVSDNFCTVINIINIDLMISAKVKKSGYYGSLIWEGEDDSILNLIDIPKNSHCSIGDTIVTSGYSNIFPEGINIGVIQNITADNNTNFLNISISILTDFKKIKYAYVISKQDNLDRDEIEKKLTQ